MFVEEVYNYTHFEWLKAKWIICQKWEHWMPLTSEEIKDVDCPECLHMYPHLYWDKHDRPHYDIYEFGTLDINDDDDPELGATWVIEHLPLNGQ